MGAPADFAIEERGETGAVLRFAEAWGKQYHKARARV